MRHELSSLASKLSSSSSRRSDNRPERQLPSTVTLLYKLLRNSSKASTDYSEEGLDTTLNPLPNLSSDSSDVYVRPKHPEGQNNTGVGVAKEAADVFTPLKSVLGGLMALIDNSDVTISCFFSFSRDDGGYAANQRQHREDLPDHTTRQIARRLPAGAAQEQRHGRDATTGRAPQ